MKPTLSETTGELYVGKEGGILDIPAVGWSTENAGEAKELYSVIIHRC